MRDGVTRLERVGDGTRHCFERNFTHKSWFQEWHAMAEAVTANEVAEDDDEPF